MVVTTWAGAPIINFQPKDQTVILYQPAGFGVMASGTAPLGYQWRKDGVPIAGATNDQLIVAQPQFSDGGQYSVIVSNAQGNVASANAGLTVNLPVAGDFDYSFASSGSVDGRVLSVAVQPDGKILIGGLFSTVNGTFGRRIARLNADGTVDYTFMSGVSGNYDVVNSVALQSDGKVLIGGYFNTVNGLGRTNIARLNPNGTLDSSFQNTPIEGGVSTIALQSDGKVLVGGSFGIARINPNGTLDSSFQNGLAANSIYSIVVQTDGKVLIGGYITTDNGVSHNNLARLNANGTLDSGFQNGLSGVDGGPVNSIAVQSDGQVLIGGYFTTVNGVGRTNLARLNADGTLDSGFQNGLSGVDGGAVNSIAVQSDDQVLIGGYFTTVNGVTRHGVARLNPDGTLDSGFQGLWADDVFAVAMQPDGKVLISGDFTNGFPVARLNRDGTLDAGFQKGPIATGTDSTVSSIAVQSDGKVLIGGSFSTVNGVSHSGIARLSASGTLDNGFLASVGGGIGSLAIQGDGKILIGGYFTNVNGVNRSNIARLNVDGTLDSGFQDGLSGADGGVSSVALQSDGKVVIGGEFITVDDVPHNRIARLNADGTLDISFQDGLSGAENYVSSVALQSDGKVLIGGSFRAVNDVTRNGIARLNPDGTLDSGFQDGLSGVDSFVDAVTVQSDGKVLIGGSFNTVNDVSCTNIARLNPDGTLDNGFKSPLSVPYSYVHTVVVQSDGKVLIGGGQNNFEFALQPRIARLNTDGTLDKGFQNRLQGGRSWWGGVYLVAVQSDGKVLVGGWWSLLGMAATHLARLWGNPPAYIESVTQPNAGSAKLTLRLQPGSTNRVQYKSDLTDPTWLDLPGDVIASGTDSLTNKVDTTAGAPQRRFYRVRQLP